MTERIGERGFALAACAVMFLWPVVTTDFEHVNAVSVCVALAAVVAGALIAFSRAPLWIPLALAAIAGIALRVTTAPYGGSDVVRATEEALRTIAAGANPYLHYYRDTDPAGQPFPYLPGELALYGIQHAILGTLDAHDRWWGIGTLLAIVALAPACGVGRTALGAGVYAVSSTNVLIGADGSNENGLLFLLALAVLAFVYALRTEEDRRRLALVLYVASALFFGWALAFKALVWAIFPYAMRAVPRHRFWLYGGIAVGVLLAFSAPYLIASPVAFVQSIAGGFTSHDNVWGFNVWSAIAASHPQWNDALHRWITSIGIFATLFTATMIWRKPASIGMALLQGATVLAVMLLFARWTSLAYYAFVIGTLALATATYAVAPPNQTSVAKR